MLRKFLYTSILLFFVKNQPRNVKWTAFTDEFTPEQATVMNRVIIYLFQILDEFKIRKIEEYPKKWHHWIGCLKEYKESYKISRAKHRRIFWTIKVIKLKLLSLK